MSVFTGKHKTLLLTRSQARRRGVKKIKKGGLSTREKKQARQIAKSVVKSRKENIYTNSWYSYDDHDPALIGGLLQDRLIGTAALPNTYNAGVNSTALVSFQTGTYLNSASNDLNGIFPPGITAMWPLGGYGFPEGTGTDEIQGDFAYLNRSSISLEIKAEVAQGNQAGANGSLYPIDFRIIHFSAKKDAAGQTPSLSSQMFLNLQNQVEGLNSAMTLKEVMTDYKLNNFRFKKLREIRFSLNQPVAPSYAAGGTQTIAYQNGAKAYPFSRKIRLNCPMPKKKIRFSAIDNGVSNAFEPLNTDVVTYVCIIASRSAPYNTTAQPQFNDVGKDFSVYATGMTTAKNA